MILYHGSYIAIPHPDLMHSRNDVDFGKGFYTTPYYEQAANWSKRFKRREGVGVVSTYIFDETAYDRLKTLTFDTYSEEWLDFILTCRNQEDQSDYDLVVGGVANDKVFNTLELYFDGLIDKKEAIKRLQYEKPNLQVTFRTIEALNYLTFEGSEEI